MFENIISVLVVGSTQCVVESTQCVLGNFAVSFEFNLFVS